MVLYQQLRMGRDLMLLFFMSACLKQWESVELRFFLPLTNP